jgi:hypothetical protein
VDGWRRRAPERAEATLTTSASGMSPQDDLSEGGICLSVRVVDGCGADQGHAQRFVLGSVLGWGVDVEGGCVADGLGTAVALGGPVSVALVAMS